MHECKPLQSGGGRGGDPVGRQGRGAHPQRHGEAVQVDPMKHTLKAPGIKRLKPQHDELLSSFAFKFNLRRYVTGFNFAPSPFLKCVWGDEVGWCRLNLSNPC